jgi:hypothetical protein
MTTSSRNTALLGNPNLPQMAQPMDDFIRLTREKRDLEARLKAVNRELRTTEDRVHHQFMRQGVNQVRSPGGPLLYLHREFYASLVPDADGTGAHSEACQALRDNGGGHLVKEGVDNEALRAFVKDRRERNTELPKGLAPLVRIHESYRIRVKI